MRRSILFVGDNIKNNKPFRNYLYREIEKKIQTFDNIKFVSDKDNSIFLIIEEMIEKFDEIIIATSNENFNLVGKIISTISDDSLVLKSDEQMLIPSKSSLYAKGTFLLEYNNKHINVICTNENESIPEILIKLDEKNAFFTLLDTDESTIKDHILPLAINYECEIKTTQITKGVILINAKSHKYGQLSHFLKSTKLLLDEKVIDSKNLFEFVAKRLMYHKMSITFAESCTGGLCASEFTKYPGVSEIFAGSLITYSNQMKEAWLGVAPKTLQNYGAVSKECVTEMLEGAIDISQSDFAIAISGIAGPKGQTKDKPVGTIYIGAKSTQSATIVEKVLFKGDRQYIQFQAAYYAMKLLIQTDKKVFL